MIWMFEVWVRASEFNIINILEEDVCFEKLLQVRDAVQTH